MGALEWNYPRPDFDRSARWLDLSGAWEFARGTVNNPAATQPVTRRGPAPDGLPRVGHRAISLGVTGVRGSGGLA